MRDPETDPNHRINIANGIPRELFDAEKQAKYTLHCLRLRSKTLL